MNTPTAVCILIAATLCLPLMAGATGSMPSQEDPPPVAIDLNRATAAELESVPGIGPATAARIIEWRQTHGRFERIEDLLDIRGIGARTLERLRPYLKIEAEDGRSEMR